MRIDRMLNLTQPLIAVPVLLILAAILCWYMRWGLGWKTGVALILAALIGVIFLPALQAIQEWAQFKRTGGL